MKAIIILTFLIFALLSPSLVEGAGFEAEITPVRDAITENQPAILNVEVTNHGTSAIFEIFTLNADFIFIGEVIVIGGGQSVTKEIKIFPRIDRSGLYGITFFVKNQATNEIVEVTARIKFVTFEDAFRISIEPELLKVSDEELTLVIKNAAETSINNARIEVESQIFSDEFEFSLLPKEERRFVIKVDLGKAEGGVHDVHLKLFEEERLIVEKDITYELEEIRDFKESRSITGFLIKEKVLTFENDGNTKEEVTVEEDSTMLEKIFSYFSEKPLFKTEAGALKATWRLEVQPYSTEEIIVKTNYLLPLILFALIIVSFAFTVRYQSTGLFVNKTASKAKSNRGTAFKITIRVKNRKDAVRDLRVRDFLPKGLKVHEKFDFAKPSKVTDSHVEWHLPLLQGGEERVFTYYMYTEEELPASLVLPNTSVHYLTLHREPKTEHSGRVKLDLQTAKK